ncbi:MAG: 2-oxoacid:acceptor oxidoreductase family protein [Chloroflexota bacterium]
MNIKLVIAGIGGQGVVYATKILSQAGLLRGEKVMASENHGMSQRGGSVMSHLKIGGSEAPLIRRGTADSLVGFDRTETMRNLTFVRASGNVFVNSTNGLDESLSARLKELSINIHSINAEACAKELGSPAVTNLIVLGFAAAHSEFGLSLDDLKNSVRALGPAKAVELNLRALDVGAKAAR